MPEGVYSAVRNIRYIRSLEEGSNKSRALLDLEEVGFYAVLEQLLWGKRSLGGAGALHVAPDGFVRV
jgi:hypothetical protein